LLSAMALKANGYRNDHPVLKKAIEASHELIWHFNDYDMYMPCVSVNWDTALAGRALLDSGLPADHPVLKQASQWFIDHQIFKKGDWSVKRPELEPGGWAFEFYNDWYPDVDDSAVILSVMADSAADDAAARERAIRVGANWVMGMQSKDGGFAAFDADNDSTWLNHLPLADVEAVTDPSCPDLTGRVLEMMASVGYRTEHPVAKRAIEWLKRAVQWLKSKQNPDGGWGESPLSDKDPAWHGRGNSTASQTAWALIGLIAGESGISEPAMRGAQWLSERQNDE